MYIVCPSCKTDKLSLVGDAPQWSTFAGNKMDMQLQTHLYKCMDCNLYFKFPMPSKALLDELYKNGNLQTWKFSLANRLDWQVAINFLYRSMRKGTILDIGCWNGEFLNNMKAGWKRYGMEINPLASNIARNKGIEIISDDFDKLIALPFKYDVVAAFNVIEHSDDPLNFLTSTSNITNENGLIIIATGNTECPTWKLSRGRYWYCAVPEHLSFINVSWAYAAAKKLNLQIEHIERFSSAEQNSKSQFLLETIKNVTYLISPALFKKLKKIKHYDSHKKDVNNVDRYPPHWGRSRDHLIVIFRKN